MNYPTLSVEDTGKRIRTLRKERKLTVAEVTDFMGFEHPQAVYKWERGESIPSVDNLYALSKLLNTTIDDILVARPECIFFGL